MRSRSAWTWIGPAVMCAVDVGATLACQPDRYWREGYGFGHESNPIARGLLELGPPALVAGGLVWILLFSVVILHLRVGAARVVALAILFGHALGASLLVRLGRSGGPGAASLEFLQKGAAKSGIALGAAVR